MIELSISLINGMMLGIEHYPGGDVIEDENNKQLESKWGIILDLLLFRISIIEWK